MRLRRVAVPVAGVAVALTVGLVGLVSCSGGNTHDPYVSPGKRHAAPALSGKDLDGKQVNLASSRGKTTVVNFWASWCSPCRAESDGLRAAAQALPGVSFVGVDVTDTRSNAVAFVRNHKLPYPSVFDNEEDVATAWLVSGLPQTFVVDAQGRVAARFPGAVTQQELTDMIHRVEASGTS